ncbi:MAG: DUF4382 domain-containing protein [Bdellovibrio sp.]|nr:DUF4382 domain-containing protein [Bdellovibrio sp.]
MLTIYKDIRILFPVFLFLGACSATNSTLGEITPPLQSYSSKTGNFRLSLTDAPARQLKSVFVNVKNAELWLTQGGKSARLVVAKNLGMVDLMMLRNGVLLPMHDLQIPAGATVTHIRLILGSGNYAIKSTGSKCDLQTPSGQQSGVKIKLTNPVTIEGQFKYSLVVDFDAEKSVVIKGNGGCLLKPVLKVAGFTRVSENQTDDNGGGSAVPGEDLTGGSNDSNIPVTELPNQSGDGTSATGADSGAATQAPDEIFYDNSSSSNMPPVITDPSLIQE